MTNLSSLNGEIGVLHQPGYQAKARDEAPAVKPELVEFGQNGEEQIEEIEVLEEEFATNVQASDAHVQESERDDISEEVLRIVSSVLFLCLSSLLQVQHQRDDIFFTE